VLIADSYLVMAAIYKPAAGILKRIRAIVTTIYKVSYLADL
jgi:hypothetical protein